MTTSLSRILLCASAAYCAQVLREAAHAGVHLHGLQPSTQWPEAANWHRGCTVLWALLPPGHDTAAADTEQQWRQRLLHQPAAGAIYMLYGNARQQAQQLAPWITSTPASQDDPDAWHESCKECLDASSEQKLFQHLLQRK